MRRSDPAGRRPLLLAAAAIAAATLAVRLPLLLQSGGLAGAASTDDGVHFAASASLLAGRLPYRDFLFLHPPGILLALLPFAALARIVGDLHAFEAARLAFIALGAVNAGLVVLALRRFGLAAGTVGGATAACAFPIVFAERSALLEPLGMACLLGAAVLLDGAAGRRRRVVGGVLLGLVVSVKLPFALPALILLLAQGRRMPAVLAGAAAAAAAVCLPFLVQAPQAMVRELVVDQAGRRRIVPLLQDRLAQVFPVPAWLGPPEGAGLVALIVLVGALVVTGLLTPGARRWAVMLLADTAMLLAGPSFYGHYAILVALPAALLVGAATARLQAVRSGARARAVVAVVAGALAVAVTAGAWTPQRVALLTSPAADPALTRAIRQVDGCTTADLTTTLVVTGALTPLLQRGCPVWPDVTGWQYADGGARATDGQPLWPDRDPRYQRRVVAYLRSGSAVALLTPKDGLSAASRRTLQTGPVLWRGARGSLHEVPR